MVQGGISGVLRGVFACWPSRRSSAKEIGEFAISMRRRSRGFSLAPMHEIKKHKQWKNNNNHKRRKISTNNTSRPGAEEPSRYPSYQADYSQVACSNRPHDKPEVHKQSVVSCHRMIKEPRGEACLMTKSERRKKTLQYRLTYATLGSSIANR